MGTNIIMTTNYSSLYTVLSDLACEAISFLKKVDIRTVGVSLYIIITIIGVSLYIFYRLKDKINKNRNKKGSTMKKRRFHKCSEYYETDEKSYDYQKILSDLHDACNNCSNLFSSMKCVLLASTYPELINIKLLSDGVTPFHRVCFHGNEPLIEFMLAKGADPESKTVAGENALCMVLYHYLYTKQTNFSCLNALYDKGSYLSRRDEWYEIFLNLAVKNNNKPLVDWIITHSNPPRTKSSMRAASAPL